MDKPLDIQERLQLINKGIDDAFDEISSDIDHVRESIITVPPEEQMEKLTQLFKEALRKSLENIRNALNKESK